MAFKGTREDIPVALGLVGKQVWNPQVTPLRLQFLTNHGAWRYVYLLDLNPYSLFIWNTRLHAVPQGCILLPCLFNFYAEYIMRNAGLEETQAGIKIAGWNINNLRHADDTTLMAESEEELKSLLMKEESVKVGLKLNIQKLRT